MIGLVKTWARDWPSIRFNAVCPGLIVWDHQKNAWFANRYLGITNTTLLRGVAEGGSSNSIYQCCKGRIPMGRLAEPSDIADGIVFLLSDASSFITGQVLPVNGGGD